ncbi:MAG TPA: ankyrin repeat domain-containing protein [Myxococcota bacterium]|nr:ankyrin repeat domain-containing protein [Myxococcota bacterium]HRY92603.1 ankyrin repeat domain-containing protein [Myxococcota bacterium]HSA23698.1 ankyrin repeat domain-containing protein [Myxococcota bacterium]
MNRATIVALILGGLMLAGSLVFYFWDQKVRPQEEAERQAALALVRGCRVHDAARAGDLALLEKQFAAGCSVNARDDFGMSPLHVAATDRVAIFLISKGASLDAKDGRGYTPLAVMKMAGRKDVVDLLLSRGAKE